MSIFHSLNMMKPVFWAFVCFIVWSESAKAAIDVFDNAEMTLTYHPQEQAFEYKLMLKGQFEGKTSFVFPHAWADGKDYRSFIADVVLNGEDVTSALSTEDPAIALTYTPSRVLSLSYKIKTKPFINIYTPTGDEELAQAPGHAIFAYPTRLPQLLRSYIQMSFNVPDGWDFLHPHRLEEGFFKGDPKEIVHALYMAKKTRCLETLYARVSFEDGFLEEAQEKILRTISQVLEHYYALFGDTAEQEPLLASFFKSRHESSWGGTYLSNSFIAEINPVVDHDAQLLIAHEIFHKWNGQKIKKHDGDKNEAKTYWWSEGFTDYYSVLCAYRAGIIPLDKFASKINQFLDDNFTSPVKNFPNERIEALFWEDQNIHHLPYHRGFLFALYLDGKIKTQTQHRFSLDDVMRDMLSHTQMHRCSFSDDLFKDLVQRYVPEGIERALDLYVLQGHSIPLEELTELPLEKTYTTNLWEGSWIHQESTSPGKFKVVVGKVLENSPAWRAGLREGEIITYDPAQNTPAQFFCKKTLETNEVVDISVPSNVRVRLLPKTPEENEGVRTYFRGPSFSSEFGDDLS